MRYSGRLVAPESISTRGVSVVAPEQRSADVRACRRVVVRCAPESIRTRGVYFVAPEQLSADVRACCLTRRHSRDEIPESGVLSGLSGSEIDLVVQFRVVLRHLQRGPGPLKQVVHVFSGVSDRHAE